jgi:hypothetical protein
MAHEKYLVTRIPRSPRLTGLVSAGRRFASTITRTRIRCPAALRKTSGMQSS